MRQTAEQLAKKQREISVAEFFERNRHLLGFDNKRKALLTVVKEAVDNALDACEEAGVLPEVQVEIIEMGKDRYRVKIEDNGPGIVKKQIPNIFAQLLYGSKFHTMKQGRGQQGIGISAAVLYSQLTTGRAAKILSKTSKQEEASYFELRINTKTNKPEIVNEEKREWKKEHGTRIELDMEATYQKGDQSVDAYLKDTAIVNPHATLIYTTPKAEQFIFARATNTLPKEPKEIKPHPHGIELGILQKMLRDTESRTLQSFLMKDFSRVGAGTAKEICRKAGLETNLKPQELNLAQIEKLMEGIETTKIIAPSTDCIVPIGAELLEKGLKKEIQAEFYAAVTRSPTIYKGIPFVVECAIAYGGEQPKDKSIRLLRFANRVPLLYQQSAGAIFKSVISTSWRSYGLSQSSGALPQGPVTLAVHIASVWPPFTSEAKEAIAHYPEIIKETKLALQECGRKLGSYVSKKKRLNAETQKRSYIEKYIPHVGDALKELLSLKQSDEEKIKNLLKEILESHRGKLKDITAENTEYDEEFAKIGKEAQ
ncbi:MAG TPA: DNA topoisomerase VI subunit B [Candidatus Woesearchaeota archaeon]|nr:DNA topoisomerase VI subunit B [Candidatus Woesearchaeota archaeon]